MSLFNQLPRSTFKADARKTVDKILSQTPEVCADLAAAVRKWIPAIQRRRNRLSRTLLIKLTVGLLRTCGPTSSDSLEFRHFRDKLRFGARILSQHSDATSVADLLSRLDPRGSGSLDQLQQVHDSAVERLRLRIKAAVYAPDYSRDIDGVIEYLSACTGYRRVKVRFDAKPDGCHRLDRRTAAKREIAAYTDGDVIHLSPWLASTAARDLNQGMLTLYLVMHEYLHMAAGSFDFSFKQNAAGRLLFRKLRPRRGTLKKNSSGDAITHQLREKLESEGINVDALNLKKTPDLLRLFKHFDSPSIAAWLLNAIEDGRLESLIEKHWPGVHILHQAHEETYARDIVRSPHAESSKENLLSATGMMAARRPVVARIELQHREIFMEVRELIENAPRRNVYDSATLMMKVYDLIEDHLGSEELEQVAEGASFRTEISIEEVVVRYRLAHEPKQDNSYQKDGRPESDWSFEPKESGLWFEEFDGITHRPKTTHVTVRPFIATKSYPALPPLNRPLPDVVLDRIRLPNDVDRRWSPDGLHIASEMLAQYTAAKQAGQEMSIHYDHFEEKPPLRWTFVFDLSISMEAPRHALGGQTPIQHAIQYGTWLASALESQGVEVQAYGAVSGGPKLCKLFRLATPVSQSIAQLRCEGAGGCRHGAFIRAIAANAPELGMTTPIGDHNLTILTDGEPSYMAVGSESIFEQLHKANCKACTSRHRCRVEGASGSINGREGVLHRIFHPLGYGLTDTADAIESTSMKMTTQLVLFGGNIDRDQYDHFLGATRWGTSFAGNLSIRSTAQ